MAWLFGLTLCQLTHNSPFSGSEDCLLRVCLHGKGEGNQSNCWILLLISQYSRMKAFFFFLVEVQIYSLKLFSATIDCM